MKTVIAVIASLVVCALGYFFFRKSEQRIKDSKKVRGLADNAWQSIKRYCTNVMKTSEDSDGPQPVR